jgi:purine-binding chemotaxis protein CheW
VLIVDMRVKFNPGAPTYDQFTIVIMPNIVDRIIGTVVDKVSAVITLNPAQIKPAPEMDAALNTDYLFGLGTVDERMRIPVDIDKLMLTHEMGVIEKMAA